VFAALLSGQPSPSLKSGTVDGVVINSVTGDPVKKATVTLQALERPANYAAVADSAGHFHFDSVEPGNYQAMANRDGFMSPRMPRDPWSKPIAVAAEQQVKDLSITLVPLAVVTGHVFDEDGDPVARAQVQALRYVYRQGDVRQLNPAGFASTNDLGEYQLLDLEPGRYYYLAAVPGRLARLPLRLRSGTPELTYPDTFYPSAIQAEQATVSQVAPGTQLTGIDFRVHKAPSYHIRGKATDGRTGQPIHNAMLRIRPRESVFFEGIQIQPNGTFDAPRVMSGSYILICQTREELLAQQIVNVGDHDVDDVVLVFRPPLEISGAVRLEGTPSEHKGTIQVSLSPLEMGRHQSIVVNADGGFALKAMPGAYRINVACDAGAYVKSMRFGDQDVSNGKIDLTQQTGGAFHIVCGTDVGQIQGSVQNEHGEPAPGALITVSPDAERQDRRDLYYQLTTDQNGKFDYQDFAPGDYKVIAWENADQEMAQSSEFRKAFESRAASVSIPAGGHASVQLKLIPAADIEAEKNKLP
jgi:hypothetical protein